MMNSPYKQNVVLDLEFTPVPPAAGTLPLCNEVIQIGAVRVAPDGTITDEFSCNVRPEYTDEISQTVRKLTGIHWSQLQDAPSFAEALSRLSSWIGPEKTRIVEWSNCDRQQIEAECLAKNVPVPTNMTRWLDLQRVFPFAMGFGRKKKRLSLHKAFAWYDRELPPSCEHEALLDALHTAELLTSLLQGEHLEQRKITASVMRTNGTRKSSPLCCNAMADALASLYAQMTEAGCAASAAVA